ncbi:sigma-54 interaction domain-containing protein [Brevibacillus fulvus]|uniref:PAS domain S-box-containing protein n=1 Tax=Brevibacillus fulvus TaxID=1125967 RepID=A0A938XZJ9_9BACL|nr:sigma 54-interacting transcriptional regulator [Brevibacillus fulvus]MBM7589769.1 PAS domain S-box-containing protein [Brevibacillus fulvus]
MPFDSLDIPLSAIARPIAAEAIIIRDGVIQAIANERNETVSVLCVQQSLLLSQLGETLRQLPQPYPDFLLLDERQRPAGLVKVSDLLNYLLNGWQKQNVVLHTILETMSEAITIVDEQNIVQFWNHAAEKIYELDRSKVIGTSLETHFARDSIRLKDALAAGSSFQRVYHVPRPDRHVLINSAPIKQEQQIIGAISIEQDITELVRLHEELTHTTAHLHNLQQEMSRFQAADDPFYIIKGHSLPLQSVIQTAKKVAKTDVTVLLYGESGVGKELFAQALHQFSRRQEQPFIAINCAAIPAALFESELFGYQGGAFTGAEKKGKPGKLELAHGGTLFLDEIGELSLELQAKLLRALQERQFYRVGGTDPITVNTRIIAATNRNLEQMVERGAFREDLYYRLSVFQLEIPPLRERKEDIPELVHLFMQEFSFAHGHPVPRIAPEVMQALTNFPWPGNIRQLKNVIERLLILQEDGVIQLEHLPSGIRLNHETVAPPSAQDSAFGMMAVQPFEPFVADPELERKKIVAALERTYGNKKAAAKLLGISRGTLYNKLNKYGLH